MSDESPCWVGFAPESCGHCVAAMVIDPDPTPDRMAEDAKELKRWQRQGLKIEKRPVAWVRENLAGCVVCCPKTYGKRAAARNRERNAEQPELDLSSQR